jgi:hypothetical protein
MSDLYNNGEMPGYVPPVPVVSHEADEFQDLTQNRSDLRKTRRCALCGGTYNEVSMVVVRGKWYCTVNECAEEAGQR